MNRLFLMFLLIWFSPIVVSDAGIFATVEVTDRETVDKWNVITLKNPLTGAVHVVISTRARNGSGYFYNHFECSSSRFFTSLIKQVLYSKVWVGAPDDVVPIRVRIDKNDTLVLNGYVVHVDVNNNIIEIHAYDYDSAADPNPNSYAINNLFQSQMKTGNLVVFNAGKASHQFSLHGFTKAYDMADERCISYHATGL